MNIADSGYFNPAEDYEIVQQILGGNKDLFEKLERKYKKPLSHLISKMVRNTDDVEDIVQETFIRAYNNLRYYKKEFAFHSWLFKIASNLCIDFFAKKTCANNFYRTALSPLRKRAPNGLSRPWRRSRQNDSGRGATAVAERCTFPFARKVPNCD